MTSRTRIIFLIVTTVSFIVFLIYVILLSIFDTSKFAISIDNPSCKSIDVSTDVSVTTGIGLEMKRLEPSLRGSYLLPIPFHAKVINFDLCPSNEYIFYKAQFRYPFGNIAEDFDGVESYYCINCQVEIADDSIKVVTNDTFPNQFQMHLSSGTFPLLLKVGFLLLRYMPFVLLIFIILFIVGLSMSGFLLKIICYSLPIQLGIMWWMNVALEKYKGEEIDKNKIIGYAQYNGFPASLETKAYLLILVIPFLVFAGHMLVQKIKSRSK